MGKEFNKKGEVIFAGNYLYNWRIKGKEYNNRILEYEGDFLFDKIWNGAKYDKDGNIL